MAKLLMLFYCMMKENLDELNEMAATSFSITTGYPECYQSVANYLQIPTGIGEGEYYEFDIADFLKKFKLNSHTAIYSLKALEQEGWLSFNEQVFLSAQQSIHYQ